MSMTCDQCGSDEDVEIVTGTAVCAECREHLIALGMGFLWLT
jgi:hypothetical protein